VAVDFAAVFRVLVKLFGITALLSMIAGLVSFAPPMPALPASAAT